MHQLVAEFERLIAAALTHPAVVAPITAGIAGVTAYLTQEYIPAESLDIAVRESGPAPPADALRVATQLAGALDFAALVQVDHGALHPRDILLSGDEARVTGLGIARALERVGVPAPVRRPYTAPERLVGSQWDRRADVFSLAALIHELLWARRVAAAGQEAADSLTAIAGGDLARLRAVFGRALAEDPGHRFGTALEFAGALKDAFPDVGVAGVERVEPSVRLQPDRDGLQPDGGQTEPLREVRQKADATHEKPPTADRRLPTEPELRLPLGTPGDEPEPAELTAAPVLAGGDLDLHRAESDGYAGVESVPPIPPIGPASGLMDSYQPLAGSTRVAAEQSRTSISPLAFALMIGAALGFAAGYGVGARDRSAAPSQAPASASVASAATGGPGREFTEDNVIEPVKPGQEAQLKPALSARPSTGSGRAEGPDATTDSEESRSVRSSTGSANPEPVAGRLPPSREASASAKALAEGAKSTDRGVRSGSLVVRSTPLGARVFVDGRDYGRTPVTVRDLARGAHSVHIIREGYTAEERRVTITPSQVADSMTVRLLPARTANAPQTASRPPSQATPAQSTAPLTVESRPDGAKVFIDGRLVGTTPLALADVATGEHALRLERDGYLLWSSSIRVVPNERNRVTASLER